MKKGKIIIINHYGITPDTPGATKHYDLSRYFADKNEYNIEFWMCGYDHANGRHIKQLKGLHLQYKYDDNGIRIAKIKSIPYWGSALLRQLNIMVFDFFTGIKLILSRNVKCVILSMPPITSFAVAASKIRGIKLVADVEDLWPLFMTEMGLNSKLAVAYMEHFANKTYNAADAVEVVSNGMLGFVRSKIDNKEKKMWLAPLGVNLNLYDGTANPDVIMEYRWKDSFKIVYCGAHGRANDLESVLKTVEQFNKHYKEINGRDVAFIFIGNGDNKENLLELKEELNLDNVFFENAVSGFKVPAILKNCDICLTNLKKIPSFKLVRPNKIFQYMAASKPILCGIWGEAAEIVEEANSGIYVDFNEHEAAVVRIHDFMLRPDLSSLGENGYRYISKYGNRDIIFDEFYKNVTEIIGN